MDARAREALKNRISANAYGGNVTAFGRLYGGHGTWEGVFRFIDEMVWDKTTIDLLQRLRALAFTAHDWPRGDTRERLRAAMLAELVKGFPRPGKVKLGEVPSSWTCAGEGEAPSGEHRPRHLRGYQLDVVRAWLEAPSRLHRRCVSMPTGGGKTLVGVAIADAFLTANPQGHVLWIAPRIELLSQAVASLHAHVGGRPLRWWSSEADDPYAKSDSIFGVERTAQPLGERGKIVLATTSLLVARWSDIGRISTNTTEPTLIVWDECHIGSNYIKSETGKWIKSMLSGPARALVGLSATPPEEPHLYDPSHSIVAETSKVWSFLAKPKFVCWETEENMDYELAFTGDVTADSLRRLGRSDRRNQRIVEQFVSGRTKWGRTLVFACDIEHATLLLGKFLEAGVACRAYHSALPGEDQRENLQAFRHGLCDVLVNVGKLTEGYDDPGIRTVLIARPTTSFTLFSQMVGRGARKTEGKDQFFVVVPDGFKDFEKKFLHDAQGLLDDVLEPV